MLLFTPVAIETSGVFGPKTTEFLKELGHRLRQASGDIPHSETLSCHPTWQCSFCVGNNEDGQSGGRVFCINIVMWY